MRAVIYDAEGYEPLTVIDVPQRFMREIERNERPPVLRFAVPRPYVRPFVPERLDPLAFMNVVTVRFEPIYKGKRRFMWLCTTEDAESALLLRAVFLPGQQGEVNHQLEEAFLKGMFAAMS
ncbi:MAG: hypothetical protein ACJ8FU_08635 [Xanthobacteraceae bacterium]